MKKIIIVEGIDRVGKSTLCKKIQDKLQCYKIGKDLDNIDLSKLTAGLVTEQQHSIVSCLNDNSIYLFDRFHLSEAVYGLLKRNYDPTKNEELFDSIDFRLANLQSVLILVKPTSLNLSSTEHGADLSADEKLFDDFYRKSHMKKFSCDYYDFEQPELYENIITLLGGELF